jgi:hypothetical protein
VGSREVNVTKTGVICYLRTANAPTKSVRCLYAISRIRLTAPEQTAGPAPRADGVTLPLTRESAGFTS